MSFELSESPECSDACPRTGCGSVGAHGPTGAVGLPGCEFDERQRLKRAIVIAKQKQLLEDAAIIYQNQRRNNT